MFRKFQLGGINQYTEEAYRFSTLKLTNREYDPEGYLVPQVLTIDGEPQKFMHSVKVEVVKEGLEVICDIDRLIEEKYTLANRGPPKVQEKSHRGLFVAAAFAIGACTAFCYRD